MIQAAQLDNTSGEVEGILHAEALISLLVLYEATKAGPLTIPTSRQHINTAWSLTFNI